VATRALFFAVDLQDGRVVREPAQDRDGDSRRFEDPARLARTSRQWTLRMPARWPWQHQFNTVLDKIRALPALA
jgi:hypothetical protein